MIMPMINARQNTLRKNSRARLIWFVGLSIWFAGVGLSTLHAQKHTFLDHYQCQLCLSSFKHTPFITSDEISILSLEITKFEVKRDACIRLSRKPLAISNRDPPIIHS